MKIKFSRFESVIEFRHDAVTVVEVVERPLFTRIVLSLQSELGEGAVEPYFCFEDAKAVSPKGKLLLLGNLPSLPVNDRSFEKSLYLKIVSNIDSALAREEDDADIEECGRRLRSLIEAIDLGLWGSYDFEVHWDLATFLKAFGYGVHFDDTESFLDRCIRFFGLCVDIGFDKPLVAINLKSFLSESELKELYAQAFFHGIKLCLLEAWHDERQFANERKIVLEQGFLES